MHILTNDNKKITLRPPSMNDVQIMHDYINDLAEEDTFILVNPDEKVSMDEEVKYVESVLLMMEKNNGIQLLAFDGEKLIGTCQVEKKGKRQNHVGIFGITLHRKYRDSGIGRQLAHAVIEKAQKELELSMIILECFANNTRALHVYNLLGFEQHGLVPRAINFRGELVDAVLMHKYLK